MKTSLNIIKYICSLSIAIGIIYLLFKNQDPIQLINEIQKVNIKWVLLSMVFGALAIINRGLRWLILIDALGYKASKLNSVASVAILYFTNLFIPRGGEITRCTSIAKVEKIPVDKLFGTILMERIIDFVFLFVLLFLTIILKFTEILNFYSAIQVQQTSTPESKIVLLFFVLSSITIIFFSLKKWFITTSVYKKIISFIAGLKEGFTSIKNIKHQSAFWLHTASIWIMYFLMTYVCFFSIKDTSSLGLIDGIYILVLGGLGMIIPTPGGIGSYHAIVMIGLSVLGIGTISFGAENSNTNPALLFPTIIHAGQTLMTIIFGFISLVILFLSKKKYNVQL